MIHVPVCLGVVGNPLTLGSNGHIIIQCGGSLIGVPLVAKGSVALQSVPPASMYITPGTVLVGFGLCAIKSPAHCIAAPSAHIATSPTTPGCPGAQVKPLLPSRRTVILPCSSKSTTL